MDFGLTGLQHIGVPTADVDASVSFYEELGFSVDFRGDPAVLGFDVAFVRFGDLVIELYGIAQAANKLEGAVNHIAVNVTDVEKAWDSAKELGCPFLDDHINEQAVYNGVRFFTVLGPNNEKIEFNQKL